MGLWIGVQNTREGTVLRPEGRLESEGVAELERVARSSERPLSIDLSQLYSADEAGIAMLQEIAAEGAELVGARPLIEYRLNEKDTNVHSEI